MNNYSIATVLAAMALAAPMVCQAQDPLTSLAKVKALTTAGKPDDAMALCEQVLKRYSGNSAMAKQFAYLMPFYAYEKGEILRAAKRYDEAYNAYKEFRDNARWKDKAMLEKAKGMLKDRMPEAYAPYLTQCIFQMGHCRYLQGAGDAKSLHVYAVPFRIRRRWQRDPRAIVLSEYGGFSLPLEGHTWNSKVFGYGKTLHSRAELEKAYTALHRTQIEPALRQGLAATVYTQLTDVEDEVNGLLTYDRDADVEG